ncbi:MAG: efflux RND transporter periplasmic adaptor subunit [Bacteroidetes bacterium]|nr:MAG: efflux RND transporter periplasmic adaptor subunit [Bacteroidota bacterium]
MLRYYPNLISAIVASALLSFVLTSCKQEGIKVQVAQAEVRDIFARVSESGMIEPTVDVPVAPDVSGEVVFIAVTEGAKVKKGDLLVTIRPDDYKVQLEQAGAALSRSQAAYAQAQAGLAQAKSNLMQDSVSLNRTRQLYQEKVVSQVDFENAQLKYEVSKSQYESARYNVQSAFYQVRSSESSRKQSAQNLDRTNIYASMDGTITKLNIEVGQRVVGTMQMAGTEILKIADLARMEVVVEINENDIVNVSIGDSARIEVDAFPDRPFYGKVAEIAYSAQTASSASTDQVTNFEVKVRMSPESYKDMIDAKSNDSPFRPGMTALVEIYTKQEKGAVSVPIQSVTLRKKDGEESSGGGQEVVFRYRNGKAQQVPVKIGISDDAFIHIKEGIGAGDTIVTGPYTLLSQRLREGMEVGIEKEKDREKEKKTEADPPK